MGVPCVTYEGTRFDSSERDITVQVPRHGRTGARLVADLGRGCGPDVIVRRTKTAVFGPSLEQSSPVHSSSVQRRAV
jgi:hypothetical protein